MLKPRKPPFRLGPDGFAPIGIYWKNLSLVGGLSMQRVLPGVAVLAVVAIFIVSISGREAPTVIGSICAALAGFLTFMGPVLFRDDLRTDLKNIDMLKAYPIPGWGVVLGEVLAPAPGMSDGIGCVLALWRPWQPPVTHDAGSGAATRDSRRMNASWSSVSKT